MCEENSGNILKQVLCVPSLQYKIKIIKYRLQPQKKKFYFFTSIIINLSIWRVLHDNDNATYTVCQLSPNYL